MKALLPFLSLLISLHLYSCGTSSYDDWEINYEIRNDSCNAEDSCINDSCKNDPGSDNTDTGSLIFTIRKYATAKYSCQSMACHGDYAFIISDKMHYIGLFNLKKKTSIYTATLPSRTEKNPNGNTKFHCNQSSFSPYKYDSNDEFPVLYISQRYDNSYRCEIVGLRIIPEYGADGEIKSFKTNLVQTLFLPAMNRENALGNANLVFDLEHQRMITYSRNNNSSDPNYNKCRISTFDIPQLNQDTIYLDDCDIRDSYEIACSAMNMQGGAVYGDRLYIGQGYESCGYINIRVVDLVKRKLQITYDLLKMGVTWEPEGCIAYEDKLFIHASNTLWEFPNIFDISEKITDTSQIKVNYTLGE